jgi:predicted metalloprotease with PDZ domain
MKTKIATLTFYAFFIGLTTQVNASELNKTINLEHVTINYQFKDKRSLDIEPETTKLISDAFVLYSKFFGGLPRDKWGKTYSDFTVHLKYGKHLGGEADPKIIMMTWNEKKLFGFASWQTILLHELFHLWNAESFRYKDGREQWFNEGFTEYYTYKTAVQLGLISASDMLSTASKPIGLYSASSGLGKISMRAAGASNQTKFDNYFLVYHGGWVVAMVLDHDIRKRTKGSKGSKSLDDLMRWLYGNFHRNKKLYSMNDLIQGLVDVTGVDYSHFFNAYIDGKMTIPVSDNLPLSDAIWAFEFEKQNCQNYRYVYETLGITSN